MALKEPKLIKTLEEFWQPFTLVDVNGDLIGISDGALDIDVKNNGIVDANNSTVQTLLADAIYTGTSTEVKDYGIIYITTKSDVASAIDGLSVQQSVDGVNWDHTDEYTVNAGSGKTFSFQAGAQYFRVVYTNGGSNQGYFRLQTLFKKGYGKPSSHRIQDSINDEDDSELVKAVLSGEDEVTANFENVQTFQGALKVTDGLVNKSFINTFFTRDTGISSGIASAITSQDRTITVADSTGFLANDFCNIRENGDTEFILLKIISISVNDITFNRPIDGGYTTAATLYVVSKNMAVAGSTGSPISFRLTPPTLGLNTIWQITRIMISMTHTTAGDDGKFGGIGALTNAVLLRTSRSGVFRTATQWFTNGDMKSDMFNVEYSDKAPAGLNGTSGRWTFTQSGAIVELIGTNNDFAEILVQGDLTGNTTFEIKAQGRIFGV